MIFRATRPMYVAAVLLVGTASIAAARPIYQAVTRTGLHASARTARPENSAPALRNTDIVGRQRFLSMLIGHQDNRIRVERSLVFWASRIAAALARVDALTDRSPNPSLQLVRQANFLRLRFLRQERFVERGFLRLQAGMDGELFVLQRLASQNVSNLAFQSYESEIFRQAWQINAIHIHAATPSRVRDRDDQSNQED